MESLLEDLSNRHPQWQLRVNRSKLEPCNVIKVIYCNPRDQIEDTLEEFFSVPRGKVQITVVPNDINYVLLFSN